MNNFLKRTLSLIMAVALFFTAIPLQTIVSAVNFTTGTEVYTKIGDNYTSASGYQYKDKRNYKYLIYTSKTGRSSATRTASAHGKLGIQLSGEFHQAICIEAGVAFNGSSVKNYIGKSESQANYLSWLDDDDLKNIKLALLCGFHDNKSQTTSPVSGSNMDDFAFATQMIVWEYQQKLRTGYGVNDLKTNSVKTPAKVFQEQLFDDNNKATPAYECYKYILNAMANYGKIPSFCRTTSKDAVTFDLKYNSAKKRYEHVFTDSKDSGMEVSAFVLPSGLSLTKSGNKYTFYTTTANKTFSVRYNQNGKNRKPSNAQSFVVWTDNTNSSSRTQTLASGVADPVKMYVNFKSATATGTAKISKTWVHNGNATADYDDIYFTVKNKSTNAAIKGTGSAGSYTYSSSGTVSNFKLNSSNTFTIAKLPAGTYTVTEHTVSGYYGH